MTSRGNPFKIRNWQWWSFAAALLVASLFLFNLRFVSANDAVAVDATEKWLSSTTVPDWAARPERSSETVRAQQANRNFCYAVADGYIDQNGDQIRDGMAEDTL